MRTGRPRVHFDLQLAERMQAQDVPVVSIAISLGFSPYCPASAAEDAAKFGKNIRSCRSE